MFRGIEERSDIQSISSFIISGSELLKKEKGRYEQRFKRCYKEIDNILEKIKELTEESRDDLSYNYAKLMDLYFEIGLKFGHNIALDFIYKN